MSVVYDLVSGDPGFYSDYPKGRKVSVYSDFEELPISAKPCDDCGQYFADREMRCAGCRAMRRHEAKKTTFPPTEKQLERINELKDLPEFQQHLDWLITAIEKGMLNTRGQAGILINEMKKKCGKI